MSRRLSIAAALLALLAPAIARADSPLPDVGDREISGTIGISSGAHTSPGGLRVGGRFLYELSDTDWFDGEASFIFGSGQAACFRDRSDVFVCDHGALDGFAGELGGGVRRFLSASQGLRPYVRVGVAARVLRFDDDGVTGFAVPVSLGAGVRIRVSDTVAIGGEGALEVGAGWLGRGLGVQLERGFTIGALAEIALP